MSSARIAGPGLDRKLAGSPVRGERSPLHDRMVFLVGARRSGTNWLQRMLAEHPAVVSIPSETHLFAHGLAPLVERFHHGLPTSTRTASMYADRGRLLDALRRFCDEVFGDLAQLIDPAAERILERTPLHVHHLGLINEVYPDAWVVHIIRDGRDVARSLLAQAWGPQTMSEAAREWAGAIHDARAAAGARYREIRYEELLADPAQRTAELLQWLGLSADAELKAAITRGAGVPFNVTRGHPGISEGKWRSQLSPDELAAFDEEAGELLADLGYPQLEPAPARPPAPPARTRTISRLRPGVARAVGALIGGPAEAAANTPVPGLTMITTQGYMEQVAALVNRFLELIASGEHGSLRELVKPETEVRVARGGRPRTGRGSGGLELLIAALGEDRPRGVRLLRADGATNALGSTIVQTHVDGDGQVSHTVYILAVELTGEELWLRRIAYYGLVGPERGERSDAPEARPRAKA